MPQRRKIDPHELRRALLADAFDYLRQTPTEQRSAARMSAISRTVEQHLAPFEQEEARRRQASRGFGPLPFDTDAPEAPEAPPQAPSDAFINPIDRSPLDP